MSKNNRKNIGFFIDEVENPISSGMCKGAMRAAFEKDVNLFVFPGSLLANDEYYDGVKENGRKYERQCNVLYGMGERLNLDAAIVCVNSICIETDTSLEDELLSRFGDIPTLVIGEGSDYASVYFDNISGIKDAVNYLIKEKGCTKIAFMAGDEKHIDSTRRLEAYKESLNENGIEIRDDYIGYGDFVLPPYRQIADLFNSAYDMEALVCASDRIALTAYLEATNRGIRVGTDLFIVGYDDIREGVRANPPLSTVRVDQESIGYNAVISCLQEGFIENREKLVLETEFVPRESVGTKARGLSDIITSISMLNQDMLDKQQLCQQICDYCVAIDVRDYQGHCQMTVLNGFFDRLISHFFLNTIKRNSEEEIYRYFSDMIERNLLVYAEPRRLTDVFDVIYQAFCGKSRVLHNRMVLHSLISRMEHKVMEWVAENTVRAEDRYEDMLHLTNDIARDILNFDDEAEVNYSSALEKMESLHISRSILCVYDNPISCPDVIKFRAPYSLLVKAYQDKSEVKRINRTNQRTVFNDLLKHAAIDDGKRHSYLVLDLFSKNDQLGLYFYEVTDQNMIYREFLTYQISSAVKTIKLFNQQREALNAYESFVERIKIQNEELLEASTIDALTSILNRRGFSEEAEDLILRKKGHDGYFLVAYADLDYLKQINDTFGHEDGDYAIRSAAEILTQTFGEFAIVGRIGGDEFAVFCFQKKSGQGKMFEDRLKLLLDKHNEKSEKPYTINISVGISEFDAKADSELDAMIGEADDILYEKKKENHKLDSVFPFTRSRVKILQ